MRKELVMVAGVLALVVGWVAFSGTAHAQKKGKTRAATTKQLMKGIVFPNCKGLGEDLKAEAGKESWEEIAQKGSMLNEAGYLLLDDGRCPDGDWAKAAKALQAGGAEIVAKAEAKDKAGVEAGFKTVTTEGCAVCHKAHKK